MTKQNANLVIPTFTRTIKRSGDSMSLFSNFSDPIVVIKWLIEYFKYCLLLFTGFYSL